MIYSAHISVELCSLWQDLVRLVQDLEMNICKCTTVTTKNNNQ